jgi:hypothetical protein
MKLSEIIAYKNLLDASTPLEGTPMAYERLNPILTVVKNSNVQIPNLTNKLDNDYRYVLKTVGDFENTIEDIKYEIQNIIDQSSKVYYTESFQRYSQSLSQESTEYILQRKLPIYKEVTDQLITRIRDNNNWRHAGMILRPGHEDWINELVGCDPLYLIDQSLDLLQPAILRFNDHYQRRLRTYIIQESQDVAMFDQLPDDQFGFCLIYNFFNYKPIEVIKIYLQELYTKLKPGGIIGLTFNDCDRAEGAVLFERHFMSFTPARALMYMTEQLGYEIMHVFRTDQSCTWMEIKKPGTLTSLRGGQSLAKVLYKDEYYHYTKEQIEMIKQQAFDLNIARSDELEQMPLGQIIQLLNQRINK